MRRKYFACLLITLLFMAGLVSTSHAILSSVGPVNPANGFPLFYQDTSGVNLELCLSKTASAAGQMCILLPDATFNPLNPIVFPTNFPGESFYWMVDFNPNEPGVPATVGAVRFALEATFPTPVPADGQQTLFGRIRFRFDPPVTGTYTITHPFGVKVFPNAPAGTRGINFTEDIPFGVPLDFAGALNGTIGPFLKCTTPTVTIGTEQFIGDPNVPCTITGSPFGTNFVRIDGPAGSNIGGVGQDFIQMNTFLVSGKIFSGVVPSPLKVDRATYVRDAAGAGYINVFASSVGTADLQVSDPAVAPAVPAFSAATMVGDALTGRFFANIPFAAATALPASVNVSNLANVPPTVIARNLTDEVYINNATYDLNTRQLQLDAVSTDLFAPPSLTAPGLGSFTLIPGPPANWTLTAQVFVPVPTVTILSSAGGTATTEVFVSVTGNPPVAGDDTATLTALAPIAVDVLANDSAVTPATLVPGSVRVVKAPAHGTTAVDLITGAVTYSPGLTFHGFDSFMYVVQDNAGFFSNNATVTITGNVGVIANNDTATTQPGIPIVINVLTNDSATAPNTLNLATLTIVTPPVGGTATANTALGTITYAPGLVFTGADTFAYTIRDSAGTLSNVATVTVNVLPATEVITILKAEFRAGIGWNVSGAGNVNGNTVAIHLGPDLTGPVIGSAQVIGGVWTFRQNSATVPTPGTVRNVSVQSSGGGVSLNFPLRVR